MSDSRNGSMPQGMAWLEEVKHNRKTQMGLGAFALALGFMAYMLWPEAPKVKPHKVLASPSITTQDNSRTLKDLEKLPDLAKLGQAGELPTEGRMFRDLFLFDSPPPEPPPQKAIHVEPPKPPTQAELEARARQQAMDAALATRPQGLRYLGYLERKSVGRIGAFVKNEEPVAIKMGDILADQWKLITLTDTFVEFQNLKYPEMRHRIEATDASGGSRGNAATNEF